jgi:hypothetical protein
LEEMELWVSSMNLWKKMGWISFPAWEERGFRDLQDRFCGCVGSDFRHVLWVMVGMMREEGED